MNLSNTLNLNLKNWVSDNLDRLTENGVLSFKLGGRLINRCKKGHKIRIKKKNKGKFTEYCGGKVTDACIAKAKKSSSPTLRKRATFAANARKWKKKK